MTLSSRFLLLSLTALSGASALSVSSAHAATSDSAEVAALRREMAEMRQEMLSMRSELRHRNTFPTNHDGRPASDRGEAHSWKNAHAAAHTPNDYNGAPEAGIGFNQQARINYHASGDGRPASDRGITSSWEDFKRASAGTEVVQIGGMKIGFPNGRPTIQSEDGKYAFSVGLAFHEDFGGFMGVTPRRGEATGKFNSFTSNARRLRIPFTFR